MSGSDEVWCNFCGTVNRRGRVNCYKCGAWGLAGPLPQFASSVSRIENNKILPQVPTTDLNLNSGGSGSSPNVNPIRSTTVGSFENPPYDPWFEKKATDTSRGLLLLAVGLIVAIIPVINVIGLILAIIGAIFVIIGREAFGSVHSRNVVVASVVYSICLLIFFGIGVSLPANLVNTVSSTSDPVTMRNAVTNLIVNYMVAAFLVGIILDIATLVFTYAIQDSTGKLLLWLSFIISIMLAVLGMSLLSQLPTVMAQAISANDINLLLGFVNEIQAYRYLDIIPAIITALAYLNARSRVDNGYVSTNNTRTVPL